MNGKRVWLSFSCLLCSVGLVVGGCLLTPSPITVPQGQRIHIERKLDLGNLGVTVYPAPSGVKPTTSRASIIAGLAHKTLPGIDGERVTPTVRFGLVTDTKLKCDPCNPSVYRRYPVWVVVYQKASASLSPHGGVRAHSGIPGVHYPSITAPPAPKGSVIVYFYGANGSYQFAVEYPEPN